MAAAKRGAAGFRAPGLARLFVLSSGHHLPAIECARRTPVRAREPQGQRRRAARQRRSLRLPDTTQFKEYKYHIRFSPDFVARPTVGYSRDNFGNGVFGGTAISLSDMVGNNHLAFALSINGRLADAQGLAAYTNLSHRLQYAVGYQQSPFYFGEGSQFLDNGDGTLTEQDVIARYLDREAFAIGIYPLNRFTRFELGLTLADLERSFLVFSQVVDQAGFPLSNATQNEVAGSSKYYVEPSLSYVSDNSLFGYTGPIYGRRYRFGVTPAIGQFQWLGLLGDYRRYDAILFSYLTIATRSRRISRTAAMPTACRSISATAI